MEAVAYSVFRNNLRMYLNKTCDDAAPLLVTSKNPEANVVVMNARDYENLMENVRIQSNPYLVAKIKNGLDEMRHGALVEHELFEVE